MMFSLSLWTSEISSSWQSLLHSTRLCNTDMESFSLDHMCTEEIYPAFWWSTDISSAFRCSTDMSPTFIFLLTLLIPSDFYWHFSYLQISTDNSHTFRFLLTFLIHSDFYWYFSNNQISTDISHTSRFDCHFSYLQIRLTFFIPSDVLMTFICGSRSGSSFFLNAYPDPDEDADPALRSVARL